MWFIVIGALFIGLGNFVTVTLGVILLAIVVYEKLIDMERVNEEKVAALVSAHFDMGQER